MMEMITRSTTPRSSPCRARSRRETGTAPACSPVLLVLAAMVCIAHDANVIRVTTSAMEKALLKSRQGKV